jgi:adenosylcobinamide amidohydrolase
MRAISSTVLGGGIGVRRWVLNAQVPIDYARTDPAHHLEQLARDAGCDGPGVGFLTAAGVEHCEHAADDGVEVSATVGIHLPVWAAAPPEISAVGTSSPKESASTRQRTRDAVASGPGTINIVAFSPLALVDAALVNAVITVTEAKTQALLEHEIDGTGTASDAVCILAPLDGPADPFCGPRSPIGAALARAVHAAVSAGTAAWLQRRDAST